MLSDKSQIFVCSFEPLCDRNVLRTSVGTLAALDAVTSILFVFEAKRTFVAHPARTEIIIHRRLIVDTEDGWDIDAVGARHAIPADGAGHRTETLVRPANGFDNAKIIRGEFVVAVAVSDIDVLDHLIH